MSLIASLGEFEENTTVMPPFFMMRLSSYLSIKEIKDNIDDVNMGQFLIFDISEYGETFSYTLPPDVELRIFGELKVPEKKEENIIDLKIKMENCLYKQQYEKAAEYRDKITLLTSKKHS